MSNEEESVSVSSGRLHFLEDVPQSIQVEVARSEIPLKTVMTWKKRYDCGIQKNCRRFG